MHSSPLLLRLELVKVLLLTLSERRVMLLMALGKIYISKPKTGRLVEKSSAI